MEKACTCDQCGLFTAMEVAVEQYPKDVIASDVLVAAMTVIKAIILQAPDAEYRRHLLDGIDVCRAQIVSAMAQEPVGAAEGTLQ